MSKKRFFRSDGYLERDLIEAGLDHLVSGRCLFEKHPRCYDSAGYLCHLGIELLLKSLLLYKSNEFPAEHSLECLVKLIADVGPPISLNTNELKTVRLLDKFKELRYPIPYNPVEIGDEDWNPIQKLAFQIIRQLPEEFQLYCSSVDQNLKGGRILMERPRNVT